MNQTPQPSRLDRLHARLTQSKYWSISLAVHAVLLAGLSTLILVQHTPTDDFAFTGEPDGFTMPLPPPRSVDPGPVIICDPPLQQLNIPEIAQPLNTTMGTLPVVSAIPTSFRVPIDIPGPKIEKLPAAPSHVPAEMANRFIKGAGNRITIRITTRTTVCPTDGTENAVIRGLDWLRKIQNDDGSWGEKNKGAMTGLALLAFLGHGETGESQNYGLTVNKAVQWVINEGTKHQHRLSMTEDAWGAGNGGVYEHGILTYAMGEYFTLTRDDRVLELLRVAVNYIVQGQGPDGGWMYHYDKTQSDTSVSGWQVQALKAAHLTKLGLPGVDGALDRAMANFARVQGPNGGYGYRTPGDRYSLSGVGVACELFWTGKRDSDLRKGVKFILEQAKQEPVQYQHEKADLYAWYYHTQAMLMFGGSAWLEWEPQFRQMAVTSQAKDGSWPEMKAPGHGNLQNDPNVTGAVYRTTLNILMLESYYRYLPSNQANTPSDTLRFAMR
jgi:hypothetical protein